MNRKSDRCFRCYSYKWRLEAPRPPPPQRATTTILWKPTKTLKKQPHRNEQQQQQQQSPAHPSKPSQTQAKTKKSSVVGAKSLQNRPKPLKTLRKNKISGGFWCWNLPKTFRKPTQITDFPMTVAKTLQNSKKNIDFPVFLMLKSTTTLKRNMKTNAFQMFLLVLKTYKNPWGHKGNALQSLLKISLKCF